MYTIQQLCSFELFVTMLTYVHFSLMSYVVFVQS